MIDRILEDYKNGLINIQDVKKLLNDNAENDNAENGNVEKDPGAGDETEALFYATVDYVRADRCGVNETIYGLSKSPEQIAGIMEDMIAHGIDRILVTRVDEDKAAFVLKRIPAAEYNPTPQIITYKGCGAGGSAADGTPGGKAGRVSVLSTDGVSADSAGKVSVVSSGKVSVVSAGTSDLPVAEEAACVCEHFGHKVTRVYDVGVAGIHRLFKRLPEIREGDVIIVVAGMEGALASVVGGLVDKPVIAVPTSVGYGANFGGISALLSMLNSCSAGVAVMNIDNGFGAANMAESILRLCREKAGAQKSEDVI